MKKIIFLLLCTHFTGCMSLSLNDFYSKNKDDINAYCKKIYPDIKPSDDKFKRCLVKSTGFFIQHKGTW